MYHRIAKKVREYLVEVLKPFDKGFDKVNEICVSIVRGVVETLPTTYEQEEDLVFSLANAKLLGYSDPTLTKICDNGAGSTGIYAQAFSASQKNEVMVADKLPKNYKEGSDIRLFAHVYPGNDSDGVAVLEIEYILNNVNGTLGNTTVLTVPITIPPNTAKDLIKYDLGTISGGGLLRNAGFSMRFARLGADGSDTHTSAIWVTRLGMTINTVVF